MGAVSPRAAWLPFSTARSFSTCRPRFTLLSLGPTIKLKAHRASPTPKHSPTSKSAWLLTKTSSVSGTTAHAPSTCAMSTPTLSLAKETLHSGNACGCAPTDASPMTLCCTPASQPMRAISRCSIPPCCHTVSRGIPRAYKWQASTTPCGFIAHFVPMSGCSTTSTPFQHQMHVALLVALFTRQVANSR